jgi:Na+/phosphate symporter
MPIFASLLTGLFGKLFDYFAAHFARNVAFKLAVGAMIVAAFWVVYAAVYSSVSLLSMAVPTTLAEAFAFVLPGNVDACLTAVVTTHVTVLSFRLWQIAIGAGKNMAY